LSANAQLWGCALEIPVYIGGPRHRQQIAELAGRKIASVSESALKAARPISKIGFRRFQGEVVVVAG
jgi:hypothetical protein